MASPFSPDNLKLKGRGRNASRELPQDEDSVIKAKEAEEREARINYTLDMVVHDLVSQGHLQPAKSYLLKTPEMREHIGKMCDRLNQRKLEEEGKGNARVFARKNVPKSKPVPKNPSNTVSDKSQNLAKELIINKKEIMTSKGKGGLKPMSSSLTNMGQVKSEQAKKAEPWITPRDIGDERKRRALITKQENRTLAKNRATRKLPPKVTIPESGPTNEVSAQAFRAKVDLSGFDNDEITLDLEGRRLMITAQRPKKGTQNARKLTEVIEIPEGVNLETLKMGRRLDGTLLIEELVPSLEQMF